MTQFVLYGGKGGVGKTTCAAATGLKLAGEGYETLVVSTDPAHSLSDAFDRDVGGDPVGVRERLWAVEIDPERRAEKFRAMAGDLADDLRGVGLRVDDEDVDRVFSAGAAPGSDEIAALDLFADYVESDRWDRIVFDTAPTGHTLRLLDLPDVMGAALESTMTIRSRVRRLGDSAKGMVFGPAYYFGRDEDDEAGDDFAVLRERMESVRGILHDPERTEFRVVTLPEKMVVAETERLVARLREDGIPVRTLVVNRVLESIDEDCERCRSRRDAQQAILATFDERFPDLAIQQVPDLVGETQGVEALEAVAERIEI